MPQFKCAEAERTLDSSAKLQFISVTACNDSTHTANFDRAAQPQSFHADLVFFCRSLSHVVGVAWVVTRTIGRLRNLAARPQTRQVMYAFARRTFLTHCIYTARRGRVPIFLLVRQVLMFARCLFATSINAAAQTRIFPVVIIKKLKVDVSADPVKECAIYERVIKNIDHEYLGGVPAAGHATLHDYLRLRIDAVGLPIDKFFVAALIACDAD